MLPDWHHEISYCRITSVQALSDDVAYILEKRCNFALDFETSSLDTRFYQSRIKLLVAGFSYAFLREGQLVARYVPIGHRSRGREANLPVEPVAALLCKLALACVPTPVSEDERLRHPMTYEHRGANLQMYLWHASFDLDVLESLTGVSLTHPDSFCDGIIRHHIRHPSLPHGLKSVASDYLITPAGHVYAMARLEGLDYWQPDEDLDDLGESSDESWLRERGTKDFTLTNPLDAETVFYAACDAHSTFRLCHERYLRLYDTPHGDGRPNRDLACEHIDKRLVAALRQMERWRIRIDYPEVSRLIELYDRRAVSALKAVRKIARLCGDEPANRDFNPQSWQQVSQLVFDQLKTHVQVRSKRKGEEADCDGTCLESLKSRRPCLCTRNPSTSKAALELYTSETDPEGNVRDPRVRALCRTILSVRAYRKIVRTYLNKLADCDDDHTVRASFSPFKASSRFSAPSRGIPGAFPAHGLPKGGHAEIPLRYLFCARDGYTFIIIDFRSQEVLLVAALSKEPFWLESWQRCQAADVPWDPHQEMSVLLWGEVDSQLPPKVRADIIKKRRAAAKAILFSILYGVGVATLAENLAISRSEAKRVRETFLANVPVFREWDKANREQARRYGYVYNYAGRRLDVFRRKYAPDGLRIQDPKPHVATNYRIQGSGAEIMRRLLVLYHEYAERMGWNLSGDVKALLTIHDEVVFEVRDEIVDAVRPVLEQIMLTPGRDVFKPAMSLDTIVAKRWGSAPEI